MRYTHQLVQYGLHNLVNCAICPVIASFILAIPSVGGGDEKSWSVGLRVLYILDT